MARVVLTGPPGSGKTTLALRAANLMKERGEPVAGFVTSDIRRGGRRTGFTVAGLMGGVERRLAVRGGRTSLPRVGGYNVDVDAFEEVALLEIETGLDTSSALVIDEIGKMELLSGRFRDLVAAAFEVPRLLATVQVNPDPFTDELKGRPDVEVIELPSHADRAELPVRIVEKVLAEDVTTRR